MENRKKQSSIVDVLKDAILSGEIDAGTEMTQLELAQTLGVSRMPVREALIVLEYQGLIRRLPNNRIRVTSFSAGYFQEIFSLCASFECKALDDMHAEEIEALCRCVETAVTPLQQIAVPQSKELALHRCLCEKLYNPFFRKTLSSIIEIYVEFALRNDNRNKSEAIHALRRAYMACGQEREALLRDYFRTLARTYQTR